MSVDTRPVSKWSQSVVDALVSSGRLGPEEARQAIGRAGAGVPVLTVLAQEGLVSMRDGLACLSAISGVRAVDIVAAPPQPEALLAVPLEVGRRFRSIGYRLEDGRLVIACAEPLGVAELRAIAGVLDRGLAGCVLAAPSVVDELLEGTEAYQIATAGATPPPAPAHAAETAGTSPAPAPAASEGGSDPAAAGEAAEEDDRGPAGPDPGPVHDWRAPAAPGPAAVGPAGASPAPPAAPTAAPIGGGPAASRWDRNAPPPPGDGLRGAAASEALRLDLDSLLTYAVENGASDLHIAEGFPPAVRIDGSIRPIEGMPVLDSNQVRRMVYNILPQAQRERFEATKELDTSHAVHGVGRFRVNVLQQRGAVGAVLRTIPHKIPPFDSLGIPKVVASFAELRRGLVLVTGPTGSGKTTTLAALIDIINQTKPLHIVTVEDPIEFLHHHGKSIVNQREVGQDTTSFAESLRHVLRQDPDVILVGEMRDLETISTAITAAETGHLVFATLHTQDAPQTIDRIIDVFPPNQQDQVRVQLAGTLEAIVTQQLILAAGGVGRVPVCEVLVCTPGIRNLIRSAKSHQVYSLMQTGGAEGMQTMDQGLAIAVREQKITESLALDRSHDPKQLLDYLRS
jgi:twitching motility protein PilT